MTYTDLIARLDTQFRLVHQFLLTVSPRDWQRPQDGRWSIAEEAAHLLNATQRTAFLFGPGGRGLWQPLGQPTPGRTADDIRVAYNQALATQNPAVSANPETPQPAPTEQASAWLVAADAFLNHLRTTVSETDLDAFAVWKHPLLGPMTAREMLYFTDYHTERHIATLHEKQS